nr:peptidylprolyl isomerase [Nanoarchaeum sp.]
MVKINQKDFVEIHYTGRIKLLNKVFDTSDEEVAKSNQIHSKNMKYGPVVICIGEHNVIKGLDSKLESRETGKTYEIEIPAEEGFGKKDPKLMKIVSIALFKKQNMQPYPGLQINADGMIATVRSVNGGRINLDFNHPLAGRDLVYTINVIKKVEDTHEKVKSLIQFNLLLPE